MNIVITGYGIVSALGIGKKENKAMILQGKTGIDKMKILQSVHSDLPVGEVKYSNDELCKILNISTNAVISRTSLLGILAVKEAIEESEIHDIQHTAFISGTTVGGMDTTEQHFGDWKQNKNIEYLMIHEVGTSTSTISKYFGGFSYLATPSTACSSALNAIIYGANLIKTGTYECVVAGGTECLSKFHLNGFNSLRILDSQPCRPFDVSRNGLNLGEGAGYIVLESEEAAIRRGANIIAYLSGYGNACDAFHQTASSENGEGAYLAIDKTLKMAGLLPSQIDYVNAHGTGTINNDVSESNALKRIFGDKLPKISSTKGFTGHTTSASGGLETAICLMCMQEQILPANLGCSIYDCDTIQPICQTVSAKMDHVLCNAFGFGGNDSCIALSKRPTYSATEILGDDCQYQILADVSIDKDADISNYISLRDSRRLSLQQRNLVVAAKMALEQAHLPMVDAIVAATQWGCIDTSVKFLEEMIDCDEQTLHPTYFIQSTHNTMASMIATLLQCHGYNCTYSDGEHSLEKAFDDIKKQITLGYIRSALLLCYDEVNMVWTNLLEKANQKMPLIARAMIISKL